MKEMKGAMQGDVFIKDLRNEDNNAIYQRLSMLVWGVNLFVMAILYVFFIFYATTFVLYALTILLIGHIMFRIVFHYTQNLFLFKVFTFIDFYCFITLCSFIGGEEMQIINFYFILIVELLFLFRRPNNALIIPFLALLFFSFFTYKFLEDNTNSVGMLLQSFFPETFLYQSKFHESFVALEFGSIAFILYEIGVIWHSKLNSLEKVNNQFQEIIDALPFEVAIIDENKRYLFVNRSAIKNRQRRNWIIGKTDMDYALEYGKDLEGVSIRVDYLEQAIGSQKEVKFKEEMIVGAIKLYRVKYINPIISSFFSNQKIMICSSVDVTDIVATTKSLNLANIKLENRNDELRSLAHMIGHDLRSPIRNTLVSLQILRKKYDVTMAEKDLQLIDTAESQMRFTINFLEDLLKYSIVGMSEVDKTDIDMNKLMVSISQILEFELKQKNVKLVIDADLPHLNGNVALVTNLFVNLILNGIKYNESDHPHIQISCHANSVNNLWKVCDNGIGISEEGKGTVFQLFTRLKTVKKYEGTGIGLSTCKKIVENFGGEIYVESELDKGTCFYIRLPISA